MNLDEVCELDMRGFLFHFQSDEACLRAIEHARWGESVKCIKCGCAKIYRYKDGRTIRCALCKAKFSILSGTIFEKTKIELWKWFWAMYQARSMKLTTSWLKSELGLHHKTAWYMIHRISELTQPDLKNITRYSDAVAEVDETYIGANLLKQSAKRKRKIGNMTGRGCVNRWATLGIYIRGVGIRCYFQPPYVTAETSKNMITQVLDKSCTVYCDSGKHYSWMKDYFHRNVQFNHNKGHYANNNIEHSQTIEAFWEKYKSYIRGYHRHSTAKYGIRYLNSFAWDYNMDNCHEKVLETGKELTTSHKVVLALKNVERRITLKKIRQDAHDRRQVINYWKEQAKIKQDETNKLKLERKEKKEAIKIRREAGQAERDRRRLVRNEKKIEKERLKLEYPNGRKRGRKPKSLSAAVEHTPAPAIGTNVI